MVDYDKLLELLEQADDLIDSEFGTFAERKEWEALPLARRLIEENRFLHGVAKGVTEENERLRKIALGHEQENERLKAESRDYQVMLNIREQDLQSRLSAAEERADMADERGGEMSAECGKCGTDLVYGDEYPDMFCQVCELRDENERLKGDYGIQAIQERDADIEALSARLSAAEEKNEELTLEILSCPHYAEVRDLQARLAAAEKTLTERTDLYDLWRAKANSLAEDFARAEAVVEAAKGLEDDLRFPGPRHARLLEAIRQYEEAVTPESS